jgi:hypothetical protein
MIWIDGLLIHTQRLAPGAGVKPLSDGGESEEDGEEVEGRQVSPAFVPRDGDAASEDGDAATGGRGMNM